MSHTLPIAVPSEVAIRQSLAEHSAAEVFDEVGRQLLALPTADARVRSFLELATAWQKAYPAEVLAVAEELLIREHRDEIALIAAPLAHAGGDPARAFRFLEKVPEKHSRRRALEYGWRCNAAGLNLENAPAAKQLQQVADLLEATVGLAREEVRGAFYRRALDLLEGALARVSPLIPAPEPPPEGLRRHLIRWRVLAAPAPEPEVARDIRRSRKKLEAMRGQLRETIGWMERGGFPTPAPVRQERSAPAETRKILYLTFASLPHHTNGNTSRTHGLLSAMTAEGWDVRGTTRPGFPQELKEALHATTEPFPAQAAWENSYRFGPVRYTNLRPEQAVAHRYDNRWKFDFLVEAAMELAQRDRPALIHGASNHLLGAAAVHAAERLGLPGVYELRGMWSLDYASLNPEFIHTREHAEMEALEIATAQRAAHVFSISRGVRDFLLARGIAPEKVTLLPNGVNPEHFQPGPPKPELLQKLGLEGRTVIGFVGTLSHYEGISTLIDALHLLHRRHPSSPFALLLIGSGPAREAVLRQVEALGLQSRVVALPTVPFHEVHDYLRLVDVIAIPRPAHTICELVTPIKPFEAMVLGKTVVASSVGGLTEIITDGETGLIHEKESAESLAEVLERAISQPELRAELGRAARNFILTHHDWRAIVRRQVTPVYEKLAGLSLPPSAT